MSAYRMNIYLHVCVVGPPMTGKMLVCRINRFFSLYTYVPFLFRTHYSSSAMHSNNAAEADEDYPLNRNNDFGVNIFK
jgi:hypothetical protein